MNEVKPMDCSLLTYVQIRNRNALSPHVNTYLPPIKLKRVSQIKSFVTPLVPRRVRTYQ